jgi:hypothetical protein
MLSLLLAGLAGLATDTVISRVLGSKLMATLAVRGLSVNPQAVRSGSAKILGLGYSLKMLRVTALLVVTQVVYLKVSRMPLRQDVCNSVCDVGESTAQAGSPLTIPGLRVDRTIPFPTVVRPSDAHLRPEELACRLGLRPVSSQPFVLSNFLAASSKSRFCSSVSVTESAGPEALRQQ